jgi:hypothetical protein
MGFHGERILIISPEPWGKSLLSKHHYALELAKLDNLVWFLQPKWANQQLGQKPHHPNVQLLTDNYSLKGARFIPSPLRKWLYRRIVRRLEIHTGGAFSIVWSFDNSRFFDLDCFTKAFRIHHMMDFHVDYQISRASKTANLCLGVTQGIVQKLKKYNLDSYFVQHGFAAQPPTAFSLPSVVESKKAIYTGNLLMPFVNWPWLQALVQSQPDVHFFFIGSFGVSNLNEFAPEGPLAHIEIIRKSKNVTLIGECTPSQIRYVLPQADVLFFAYRSAEFPEILANTHKLMAYFDTGKPIVCSNVLEYLGKNELLVMANSQEEFIANFEKVMQQYEYYNRTEWIEKRKSWASDNTYFRQIQRIENMVQGINFKAQN